MHGAIVVCFCLSDFARWGFDSTMRKKKNSFEFSIKMLFQYTDNPERELKLRNVQLLKTVNAIVFRELLSG